MKSPSYRNGWRHITSSSFAGPIVLVWLRKARLRRLVIAVVLGTFLPVASATMACLVACAYQSNSAHLGTAGGHAYIEHDVHEVPAQHLGEHLKHAGPCHLAAVPVLSALEADSPKRNEAVDWAQSLPAAFSSIDWPPPKHRPRV
jgi:hypothetical protein